MNKNKTSEILLISSYPPRECGIATYTQDLARALKNKFSQSFNLQICALESETEKHTYIDEVQYTLDTTDAASYDNLAYSINTSNLKFVLIQHEFGFFNTQEESLLKLVNTIKVPVGITFHTVLPNPDEKLKLHVQNLSGACEAITVMTRSASQILQSDYEVPPHKIKVIAHGTHLVKYMNKTLLKRKYGFTGKKILSTFGLISSGKNIETTLEALPGIIRENPDILFLVIGKTHPGVVKQEGEKYRNMLEAKVKELKLEQHVRFINYFLRLPDLLEYLQLTDIYLFTSKDPNQAVSGTFSYAISCGCPVISTPIPHAREVLSNDAGILIDFENAQQLGTQVNRLLGSKQLRKNFSLNGLHKIVSTTWENVAVAHALIFKQSTDPGMILQYSLPDINLDHIKNMTTDFGMLQFSKINHPDPSSGYTIDDNARAMIAMCMHYKATGDVNDLVYISKYLHFIEYCTQANGRFLNYLDKEQQFTQQNRESNLDDANGRAIWALGYLISHKDILPSATVATASRLLNDSLVTIEKISSTRAIAFAIKGLSYYHSFNPTMKNIVLIGKLASKLERMYAHECDTDWNWFESYLTYGNSILPEAMLCAYQVTNNDTYKSIAKSSFNFLLLQTFTKTRLKLISNKSWLEKGKIPENFGEQPVDSAYTILALGKFYDVFEDIAYLEKMQIAFNWFLGNNHLHQIIYNPCTGGCYDGLEESHINLNQGAESTVSYLMARLTFAKYMGMIYYADKKIMGQKGGWPVKGNQNSSLAQIKN